MLVDPDGHWVWLVVNAGFAAYGGYKAYKSGKGWKGVAGAAAMGFIGGGRFGAINKIRKVWQVGHHMPRNAYLKTIGISRNKGPAVLMSKSDHKLTRTYAGKGKATMRRDAGLSSRKRLARDVWDVKRKFGKKYNRGLRQAVRYGQKLFPKRKR